MPLLRVPHVPRPPILRRGCHPLIRGVLVAVESNPLAQRASPPTPASCALGDCDFSANVGRPAHLLEDRPPTISRVPDTSRAYRRP